MSYLKSVIKVPLVFIENIVFTLFPNSRETIEKLVFNPYFFGSDHADYSVKQFDAFLKKIQPEKISGKNLLELGPGGSIGFGLLALKSGAQKYFALENGNHARLDSDSLEEYRKILDDSSLFRECFAPNRTFNPEKIQFIQSDQSSHYPVPENSIDFIYSCAVLEHVHDLDLCFSEMSRVLKTGGIMNHQVDLRDHIFSQKSLWFLNIPDRFFRIFFSKTGEYVNRKRLSYYLQLFEKNRLEVVSLEKTIVFRGKLSKRLLKKYTKGDLRALSFNVILRKS